MNIELVDRRGFYKEFLRFGDKLVNQYKLLTDLEIDIENDIKGIVISGMGGSGITGDIIYDYIGSKIDIPLFINKSHDLPRYINDKYLVIAISYSGDTIETLNVVNMAYMRGIPLILISSGGKFKKLSDNLGLRHIMVKRAMAPRSALPELFSATLRILERVLGLDFKDNIYETARYLRYLADEWMPVEDSRPFNLAENLLEKTPIIYVPVNIISIAIRAKTAFNENSKINAYFDSYPEMFHNEVMAYDYKVDRRFKPILVGGDSKFEVFFDYLIQMGLEPISIEYPSDVGKLAALFKLIMLFDLTSVYLAVLRGVDPYPVRLIKWLKGI